MRVSGTHIVQAITILLLIVIIGFQLYLSKLKTSYVVMAKSDFNEYCSSKQGSITYSKDGTSIFCIRDHDFVKFNAELLGSERQRD